MRPQIVSWREGTNAALTSRLATVRMRPAHRDYWLSKPHPEEWLLIEQPEADAEPGPFRTDFARHSILEAPNLAADAGRAAHRQRSARWPAGRMAIPPPQST